MATEATSVRAVKSAPDSLLALDAVELRDRLASGALRARALAEACLERVRAVEPQVRAWTWLEEEYVLAEADRLDALRRTGRPVGPLHGLPVALKDVIDTRNIATENGTVIDKGRVPAEDAVIVARLRAAGALIMGKTVTTELAFLHPGATLNPHNAAHTPGGSSQGSAAAVAAGMVPLAIGTQTGGSVIRPAAYCGVVGYKPSFGAIPRTGVLEQSPSLDTIGVFARTVGGAAMLADVLFGSDPGDRATSVSAPPRLLRTAINPPPVSPTYAILPALPGATLHPDMQGAIEEIGNILGEAAFQIELPPQFNDAAELRERINFAEMAKCFYRYARRGSDQLSVEMQGAMAQGNAVLARDYLSALDWPHVLNAGLNEIFQRCDVILCPSTEGPAPAGLGSTGSAICNGLWTLCGTPCVSLPLFTATNGLPLGLQIVGRQGDDARLLRTARHLWTRLADKDYADV